MKKVHTVSQQTTSGIRAAALAACAAVAFTLVGCGGSSSSAPANTGSATTTTPADGATTTPASGSDGTTVTNTPASASSTIEGMWLSDPYTQGPFDRYIFLDDGTFWETYGDFNQNMEDVNLTYGINGVSHGSISVTGNTYTMLASQSDVNPAYNTINGNASGSLALVPNTTLTLTSSSPNVFSISFNYDPTYNQPVALASLAGDYVSTNTGSGYPFSDNYAPGTVTITADGALTLSTDTAGCAANGTIAHHITSHGPIGVFDLNLTFSGATCPLGNGIAGTGVAYLTDGGAFIEGIGLTSGNTNEYFAFRAHRAQ
jgi:hypothetical protein